MICSGVGNGAVFLGVGLAFGVITLIELEKTQAGDRMKEPHIAVQYVNKAV